MRYLGSHRSDLFFLRSAVLLFCFSSLLHATIRDVTTFGAVGNGTNDDTAAINSAINALVSGDELFFPCAVNGTYKVTSQLHTMAVANVQIDGQTGCSGGQVKIVGAFSGSTIWVIGNIGGSCYNTASSCGQVALSANAAELATTFSTSLSLAAGNYVYIFEGGKDGAGGNNDTTCDSSGPCRGEVVKILSYSGGVATIDTSVQTIPGLHFPYNTANLATVAKLSPVTGLNIHDLTFNGSGTVGIGVQLQEVINSTITNVTSQNWSGGVAYAISDLWGYNNVYTNVTLDHCGSGSGACFEVEFHGHLQTNGVSVSNISANDGFGSFIGGGADDTISGLTVDGPTASTGGREIKFNALTYSVINNLLAKNGHTATNNNAISFEYYSSHVTLNNCQVINNPTQTGIVSFGNYNTFLTFNNCTVTGNLTTLYQGTSALGVHQDNNVTISGGTWGAQVLTNNSEFTVTGANAYIHDAAIKAPGGAGIQLIGSGACINNNTFTSLSVAISSSSSTNVGAGNVLNGANSDLTSGSCGTSGLPTPPTGLTATVN